ncbi:3588_t:CDS:2, partial [Ambispora leptoticha]
MVNKKRVFELKQSKPQRLTDKAMHQLLTNLKREAYKTPEEKGSFSLEVICSGKDMQEPNETPLQAAKREVFEETNLIIEDLEIVAEKEFFSDELQKNKTGYLIKANKYSGEIKIKESEKIADIQINKPFFAIKFE